MEVAKSDDSKSGEEIISIVENSMRSQNIRLTRKVDSEN